MHASDQKPDEPADNTATRPGRVLALALILGLGLFFAVGLGPLDQIEAGTSDPASQIAPPFDPATTSGFARDLRVQVLPSSHDSYQWIQHAQRAAALGLLRLRDTDIDNAPYGRPVHWSQSGIWLLRAVGFIHSLLLNIPHAAGIEAAAVYAMPLVFVAAAILLALFVYRRVGEGSAAVIAFALPTCLPLSAYMNFGQADHHGLIGLALLTSILCLPLALWPARPDERREQWSAERRRLAAISGIAGGTALWISASSTLPVIAATGLGLLTLSLFSRRPLEQCGGASAVAALIRRWGAAGALTSTLFYLIEYFPFHLGFRLEVNHPLHALAWWAGAKFVAIVLEWRFEGQRPWSGPARMAAAGLSLLAIAPPGILLLIFREKVFALADPFLGGLYEKQISELQTMGTMAAAHGFLFAAVRLAPTAAAACLTGLALRSRPHAPAFVILIAPLLVTYGLALYQVRWSVIANPCALAVLTLAAAWIINDWKAGRPRWTAAVVLALLLAWQGGLCAWRAAEVFASRSRERLDVGEANPMMAGYRAMAHAISERMPPGARPTILSSPSGTLLLSYFGGAKGLGSYYWENHEGLKAADALFLAESEEALRQGLTARGVTHIVLPLAEMRYLLTVGLGGTRRFGDGPRPRSFLKKVIEEQSLPCWLSPLLIPRPASLKEDYAAVLEVRPAQSEAEALAARGEYDMMLGKIGEARARFEEALKNDPGLAMAHLNLARLASNEAELREAVGRAEIACSPASLSNAALKLIREAGLRRDAFLEAVVEAALRRDPENVPLQIEQAIGRLLANPAAGANGEIILPPEEGLTGRDRVRLKMAKSLQEVGRGEAAKAEQTLVEAFALARKLDLTVSDRREIIALVSALKAASGKPR